MLPLGALVDQIKAKHEKACIHDVYRVKKLGFNLLFEGLQH